MIERTLIIAKPDAVQRGLVGDIIKRFEKVGLKISGIKMITPTNKQVGKHYPYDKKWLNSVGKKTRAGFAEKGIEMDETDLQIGSRIRNWLMEYMASGPVVAMVFEGVHACEVGRKIVGSTEPRTSSPGTIRGDYAIESYRFADSKERPVKNLVHAAETPKDAEKELKIWFSKKDLMNYNAQRWEIHH